MLVSDLINLALTDSGVLGVGQTAQVQDTTDALTRLNIMLGEWSRKRWLVFHLVDTAKVCTGAQSYTVGPGGDFNIARPDRIEAAYLRQVAPASPTPVDFPLAQIMSREDYSQLRLKALAASPSDRFFYDSAYPNGVIYPWPIPNGQFELHILTKDPITAFANTAATVLLPDEYQSALLYNLMQRLRIGYRLPADPEINRMARNALNTLRKANTQIGRLNMPRAVRTQGVAYNPFSDTAD